MNTISPKTPFRKKFSIAAIISLFFGLLSVLPIIALVGAGVPYIQNFQFSLFPPISILSGIFAIREIKKRKLKGRLFAIIGITLGSVLFSLAIFSLYLVILVSKQY